MALSYLNGVVGLYPQRHCGSAVQHACIGAGSLKLHGSWRCEISVLRQPGDWRVGGRAEGAGW